MKDKHSPVISVIMSVYNTPEQWLRDSIESICEQTYRDIEFIIILDHPTDSSEKIISEYAAKDNRIIVINNGNNMGLTKSLNKGLSIAKGKYIARMDSDDVAFRNRLEKQFEYMEMHPEVVALGTQVCTSLDPTHAMDKYPVSDWTPDQDVLKIRMLFHNVGISHPTAMFRHDVILEHGITYDERIKKSQDYKLWVDLMPYGSIDTLNEVLLLYRVHEGQISTNRKNQYQYVHMVAEEQAGKLLDSLSENEKDIHNSIATTSLDNISNYSKYIKKMIILNQKRKIYNQAKFVREMNYMWIQKAFRRIKKERKFDMVFSPRILSVFQPTMIQYIKTNKEIKQKRKKAILHAEFDQCIMR